MPYNISDTFFLIFRLQKIMDLSIQVHGELNSLYDMVFAFVECGKVHQARKLVEVSDYDIISIIDS